MVYAHNYNRGMIRTVPVPGGPFWRVSPVDPSPSASSTLMRPHIAYAHNEPCATLILHFCDDLGRFALKDDKGRHTLRPFAMSYTILQYSTVLPFTFATFSNLF